MPFQISIFLLTTQPPAESITITNHTRHPPTASHLRHQEYPSTISHLNRFQTTAFSVSVVYIAISVAARLTLGSKSILCFFGYPLLGLVRGRFTRPDRACLFVFLIEDAPTLSAICTASHRLLHCVHQERHCSSFCSSGVLRTVSSFFYRVSGSYLSSSFPFPLPLRREYGVLLLPQYCPAPDLRLTFGLVILDRTFNQTLLPLRICHLSPSCWSPVCCLFLLCASCTLLHCTPTRQAHIYDRVSFAGSSC